MIAEEHFRKYLGRKTKVRLDDVPLPELARRVLMLTGGVPQGKCTDAGLVAVARLRLDDDDLEEGDRVECEGGTGTVTDVIGDDVIVELDEGGTERYSMDDCDRLDGDWDEDAHPRGEGGKFGEGGGGGEKKSKTPAEIHESNVKAIATGVGASGGHAAAAQGHAERARAAVKGTSASARASARKAEEHSALAQAAHAAGNHAAAAEHAANAEKHANVAVGKATEHKQEAAAKAMGDKAPKTSGKSDNSYFDPKAAIAASDNFNNTLANITHGTAANKAVMAKAEGAKPSGGGFFKGKTGIPLGNHESQKVTSTPKAEPAKPAGKPDAIIHGPKASAASSEAHDQTKRAEEKNTSAAHITAAKAHDEAAHSHHSAGNEAVSKSHRETAQYHRTAAYKLSK